MRKEQYRAMTLKMLKTGTVPATPTPPASPHVRLPCVYETGAVFEYCKNHRGEAAEMRHLRGCDKHERCTRGVNRAGIASCKTCADYDDGLPKPVVRTFPKEVFDTLAPTETGFRFNPGLIEFQGKLLLAYRTGWYGSQVAVSEVLPDFSFGAYKVLSLNFPYRASYGREDPRLFVHKGKLHVAFIGVSGKTGPTHQMYARLGDDLSTEAIFYPHYEKRQSWEKNWEFFSREDRLFAVYSISPHRVLEVDGGTTREFSVVEWNSRWRGGMMRGGASPVLVGDEYWCWFHGRKDPARVYSVGVYCFSKDPPFAPTRYIPDPLYYADKETKPKDQYIAVTFPSGAVLKEGKWTVACGVHDRWIEFHEWDHGEVSRAMTRI